MMYRIILRSSFILSFILFVLTIQSQAVEGKKQALLLGASVGKAWDLPNFPNRMKNDHYRFETVAAYQYDKTEALEEILMRPQRKFHLTKTYFMGFFKPSPALPNMIILKECAAYFPGDLNSYKALMKKWVAQIRAAKIQVVLATVVPVTQQRAGKKKGQIEEIRAFNDWMREYARTEKIPLLDMEAALRRADARFLKDDLTDGDGLHLNKKAYDILDRLLAMDVPLLDI